MLWIIDIVMELGIMLMLILMMSMKMIVEAVVKMKENVIFLFYGFLSYYARMQLLWWDEVRGLAQQIQQAQ